MSAFGSITTNIDYERDGKQVGNLRLVQSAFVTGWQTELIPVVCLRNGDGPTLLLLGGTHGDEVDGPVALMRLLHALEPGEIRGRVIAIPALNFPAVEACRRTAPSDGKDLNRCFPGDPDGTFAQMLAAYLDRVLLPMSRVVIDLHAGGRWSRFLPSLWLLEGGSDDHWRFTQEVAKAFGAPLTIVSGSLGGDMSESAARRGCAYISTESGGAASVDPAIVAMCEAGIRRVMAFLGMVPGDAAPPADKATRFMRVPGVDGVQIAEGAGLFEPAVELGDRIEVGEPIGHLYRIDQPMAPPVPVRATTKGLIYGLAWLAHVKRGDRVCIVAEEA
ncbi:MAG: succinylglutamate desuccinylase [Alphaproteobacteria bacterium]|nr:succinylglutamate desuccinylase [Alphaproteobacteria bacterium]